MVRILRAALFPTYLIVGQLQAPINVGINAAPYYRHKIVETVGRLENCRTWNNPGCLKWARQEGARRGADGYARFDSFVHGRRALELWWDRHGCQPLSEALAVYNPANEQYAAKVLNVAGLPGDLVIGEGCQ